MGDQTNCLKCEHRIFDEVWGDYKCAVRQHRIYIPTMYSDCEYFKKGEGTVSKRTYENYESLKGE